MGDGFKRLTRRLAIKVGATLSGAVAVSATGLANWLTGCSDDTTSGTGGSGGSGGYGSGGHSTGTGGSGGSGGYGYGYGALLRRRFRPSRARV